MKKVLPILIILIVIGGIVYTQRHAVKNLLMGAPAQAPTTTTKVQQQTSSSNASNSAMAPSDNIYKLTADKARKTYLADFQGMTLYTYDKDTKDVSNCEGACLKAWPVYTSGATAQKTFPKGISVITRKDGSKQFAWKGMPLYYYASDQKAGDMTGDGVGGVWHVARP